MVKLMSNNLFSTHGGLFFSVDKRDYGAQDKGISLGGAQDQTSFATAYNIFEKPTDFKAIEILYPIKITAEKDILFILCGAGYADTKIDESTVSYNEVGVLKHGQELTFAGTKQGFRTLFFAVEKTSQNTHLVGEKRSEEISAYVKNNFRTSMIRIIKGPEYDVLNDDSFTNQGWVISPQSSQMGLSLSGEPLAMSSKQMISQPVVDGTIQLSPSGPIVLMRHRQTVGGYPRIATVIEQDIDKLAQIPLGTHIKFQLIDLAEAKLLTQNYHKALEI
jgi:allophanate hydrolase subunit 2